MSSKFSFKSVGSGLAFYAPIIYAALFLIASLMFHSLVYYERTATLLILTSIVNIVRVVFMPQYRQSVGCVIKSSWLESHYPLNISSEIPFYILSLYIRYLQMFSFGLNTHEISRF